MIFIKIPTIVINSITIALMLITTFAVERIRANKQKTKFRWLNIILSVVAGILLFLFFTEPLVIFKNFLLVQVMLYASNQDFNEHQVDDYIYPMICVLSLVFFNYANFVTMIVGALALFIIQMIVFFACKGSFIGGADVKFTTACGFFLGLTRGFVGTIIGLLIAIIVNMIIQKVHKEKKNQPFPLVPYLSIGMFIGIFFVF